MNSIVEDLLQDKSNLSLPYRSVFVIRSLCFFKMLSSDFLILIKRDCLPDWKSGQWRRKWVVASIQKHRPGVFLGKGVLKMRSIFTGEHLCRRAASIKFQSNFIEITLRHGCSPVNLLHIFKTPFLKNTSGWLLLSISRPQTHIRLIQSWKLCLNL